MKTASFFCPADSVFRLTMNILTKKGYIISDADSREGSIKAYRRNIFKKTKKLYIQISRIDRLSTGLRLMINQNIGFFERPFNADELEEDRLISSINRHF